MSKAKKINEGTVTSLADTDLIVAADSAGSLRPISVSALMSRFRDSIQIGGRNLLNNTAGNHTNVPASATDYNWWIPTVKLKEGVSYTLSFECDDDLTGIAIELRENDKKHFTPSLRKGANNRYHGTQTWKNGDCLGFSFVLLAGNKVLRNIKLEQGNIPTDWSPSPEDLSGGVMRRYSICYNLPLHEQKGGQRNEQSDNSESAFLRLLFGQPLSSRDRQSREHSENRRSETATPKIIYYRCGGESQRASDTRSVCHRRGDNRNISGGWTHHMDVLSSGSLSVWHRHSSAYYEIQCQRNGDKILRYRSKVIPLLVCNSHIASRKEVVAA